MQNITSIIKKYKWLFTVSTFTIISGCLSVLYFGSIKTNEVLDTTKDFPSLKHNVEKHEQNDTIKFIQYDAQFIEFNKKLDGILIKQEKWEKNFEEFKRDINTSQIKTKDEIIDALNNRRK